MDWCLGVEEPLIDYILPIVLPVRPYEEVAYAKGKAELHRQLETLERHLASSGRTFLAGQALSLADVLVAWTLITPFLVVGSVATLGSCCNHQRCCYAPSVALQLLYAKVDACALDLWIDFQAVLVWQSADWVLAMSLRQGRTGRRQSSPEPG